MLFHQGSELYGSDRMFLETVAALTDVGINCTVVTPTAGPLTERLGAKAPKSGHLTMPSLFVLRRSKISGFILPSLLHFLRSTWIQYRCVRKICPDVVWVNTVVLPATVIAARLARRPVVVHVHEDGSHLGSFSRLVLFFPLCFATRIVAASRSILSAVSKGPCRRSKTALVMNAVAHVPRHSTLPRDRPNRMRILFIGRISEVKGLDIFLGSLEHVVKEIPVEVRIVGDSFHSRDSFSEKMKERINDLSTHVRIERFSFEAEPSFHYDWCHVVVVPSRAEPFGLVALEAQLAGRLAVVSGMGGLTEIVEHGVTGLIFDPTKPEALASGLSEAYNDWDKTTNISVTGRNTSLQRFSLSKYRSEVVRNLYSTGACREHMSDEF